MVAFLIFVVVFCIVGFLICVLSEEDNSNKKGTYDIDAMWKDNVKVATGELSLKEYKRRVKCGYYDK